MKKIIFGYFFFILLSFNFSCISNELKEGEIIAQWHEPQTTTIMYIPMTMPSGKNSTITILIPYFIIDNEDWCVKIKGIYKDKTRIETVYITEKQYNCVSVGAHFVIGADCSFEDNNNVKEKVEK